MSRIVISGSGIYTPTDSISNDELVASFNSYVEQYNGSREKEIMRGEIEPLKKSSAGYS